MTEDSSFTLRQASPPDDMLITENFYLMWQEYDMTKLLKEDWQAETLEFIQNARIHHKYAAFIAEREGKAVGSAACQLFNGLYPDVFQKEKRLYSYVWAVYVAPEQRGQGIAKALTQACIDYSKSMGCTKVLLHAAPMGKPVYEKLNFLPGNEMILDFSKL
jgi:GNAT superfamily N-acetyltransferase